MSRIIKRGLAALLCALMLLALLPLDLQTASADASGRCGDDLYWSFDESTGTLAITGSGEMWAFDHGYDEQPWVDYQSQIISVDLPDELTSIGRYAFDFCTKLTQITVPDSVTSIGEGAFEYCTGLTEITIPDGVTSIGIFAFSHCTGLTSIYVDQGNTQYSSIDGVLFVKDHKTLIAYPAGRNDDSYTIPDTVTSIGRTAFCGCTGLQSITIPDSVTSIGEYAFYHCTGLTEITIPDSVTSIGEVAFAFCTGLTEITIPDSVTSIGIYAFSRCTGLTEITIPSSVTYIGSYKWDVFGSMEYLIDVPAGAFSYCTGLKAVVFEDGIKIQSLGGFEGCTGLTSITIPDSVTSIEDYAFEYCTGLTEITIPSSVTYIGYFAFDGCTGLTDVYYTGNKAQKDKMSIDYYNDPLRNATWHYYTIEWNPEDVQFKGSTPYVIANGKAQTPRFTVKDANGNTISAADYHYTYKENTNAGTGYVIVTLKNGDFKTIRSWFKIYLPATTKTEVANVSNGIKITWAPVEGAAGYVVYRRAWSSTTNGWTTFERWNNTPNLSYVDTAVYAGTRYQYGVKAYFNRRVDPISYVTIGGNVGDNYNLGMVGPLKTTVRITTRTLKSLTAGSRSFTAVWDASKLYTGYQIKYSTDGNFMNDVKSVWVDNWKIREKTVNWLQSGKTYYVCIRSYHIFEGVRYFGEWSNVMSVRVK